MGAEAATTRTIVRDGIAVGVATGAYGISFGAVSLANGLDVWQSCALSLLVFTGASQFALVGVIGAGGTPLLGALSGLLLGTRNTLYGLKVAPLLGWRGVRRWAAAYLLLDESSAMTLTRTNREHARAGFLSTGLSVFVLWNLATLLGALAGDSLGDPRSYGLDAAVGAAFLGLLWPRLDTGRNRVAALLGAGVALSLVPLTPAGVPVLAASVVALGMALIGSPEQESDDATPDAGRRRGEDR
jgi:predicted branched-subunit amino acid permease